MLVSMPGAWRALFTAMLAFGSFRALAAPLGSSMSGGKYTSRGLERRRGGPHALSGSEATAFDPYSWYASAAYCKPETTLAWNCGSNCEANGGFKPVASGGDGVITQFWYVGYDPKLETVIVAHQGTHMAEIIPLLTDVDFNMVKLAANLFGGLSKVIEVHDGFHDTHSRSAPNVLSAVKKAMQMYNCEHVTIVGHSLGAAIALLDAVYLPLHLPKTTTFKTVGLGMPRVGNQAFVDYVNTHADVTRINNRRDPVPIIPPEFLGFRHSKGEIHIDDPSGTWYRCSGGDNHNEHCEEGDADNIFETHVDDHFGPYGTVRIGCE